MRRVRTIRVIRSTADARARGTAELCLKFGNAIREDRVVLHRERPKKIGRGIVQLPPFVWDAKQNARPFVNFDQQYRRHSSVTEHAPRKDETEV